jgi:hypothetical protein
VDYLLIKIIVPLKLQQVLPFITGQSNSNSISQLINSILVLEERLSNPHQQSEYFQWASESYLKRLSALQKQYEVTRLEYNENTIEGMLYALEIEEKHLQEVVPNLTPIFARVLVRNATIGRINKLNDYVQMKSTIEQLPPLEELRDDIDLLLKLLR